MISKQYAAGFFDGEGSISITVSHNKGGELVPHLRVAVSNMDPMPLRAMRVRWRGSLSQSKGVWNLCFNGADATNFLNDVYDHLMVKQRAALAAVHMMESETQMDRLNWAISVCEIVREGYRAIRTDKTYQSLLTERQLLMKKLS